MGVRNWWLTRWMKDWGGGGEEEGDGDLDAVVIMVMVVPGRCLRRACFVDR